MPQKRKNKKFTSKYCPSLDDEVVLLHTKDANGFLQSTCFSSHLCHGDARRTCEHGGIREEQAPTRYES